MSSTAKAATHKSLVAMVSVMNLLVPFLSLKVPSGWCTRKTKVQCAQGDTHCCIDEAECLVTRISCEENHLVVLSILLFLSLDFQEIDGVNISVIFQNKRAFTSVKEYPIREDEGNR